MCLELKLHMDTEYTNLPHGQTKLSKFLWFTGKTTEYYFCH
jgi:hypothetical protein